MAYNKGLSILLIVFLCWGLAGCSAKEIHGVAGHTVTMPESLVHSLMSEIASLTHECGHGAPGYPDMSYYRRNDSGLMMFMHLPDYLCTRSNSFIPVTLSKDGQWARGKRIYGLPSLCVEDSEGVMWLTTQWQVEGSYPSLYRSRDGAAWTPVPLPENRRVDCCFEFITEVCFDRDLIRLGFQGAGSDADDAIIRYWDKSKKKTHNASEWKHIENPASCETKAMGKGAWMLKVTPTAFCLTSAVQNMTVIIPKRYPSGNSR